MFQKARAAGIYVAIILTATSYPTGYASSANDCFPISTFDSLSNLLQDIKTIICSGK